MLYVPCGNHAGKLKAQSYADSHHVSLRRIFSPRGLDTLQNRKSKEYNCAYYYPVRGDM